MNKENFHLEIGQTLKLSEYSPEGVVIDRLRGGFGEVYVIKETGVDGSLIAVKTPRRDLSISRDILDQFAHEATLWSKLPRHPNILPAYDVLRYNNQPYVRMKYVGPYNAEESLGSAIGITDGDSNTWTKYITQKSFPDGSLFFRQRIKEGVKLGGQSSLRAHLPNVTGSPKLEHLIISQILGVLVYLERKVVDFVHGDIKPENILLEFKLRANLGIVPQLLLSDFGFARARLLPQVDTPLSSTYSSYVAPETFSGVIGTKGHDVFALGGTLFEMLTGRVFNRQDENRRVISPEHIPTGELTFLRPDTPVELIRLVLRCLDRNPSGRPSTFAEIFDQYIAIVRAIGGEILEVTDEPRDPIWHRNIKESELATYLVNHRKLDQLSAENIVMDLTEANRFAKLGKYQNSENMISAILDRLPDFAPALANRGYRLSLQQNVDASIHWYGRAVEQFSSDQELINADQLGYGAACATLAQLLATHPKSNLTQLLGASDLSRVALKLLPTSPKVYLTAGLVCLRLGQAAEAREMLLHGQSLDSTNRAIRNTLATTDFVLEGCKREILPLIKSRFGLSDIETESMLNMVDSLKLRCCP